MLLDLRVRGRRMLTPSVCEFELVHPAGHELPRFEPGAHINVETPVGAVRSYSLTNDPRETDRYVIAVKREDRGRGGSASLVERVREGSMVRASGPSNSFPMAPAAQYLFIAGGIGITPILCMMRSLIGAGQEAYHLIYCTRSRLETAFRDELSRPEFSDRITLHHDHGKNGDAFDFWPHLREPGLKHVYCCGPVPLMERVRSLTVHWPPRAVHFEDFAGISPVTAMCAPFRVRRASTGEVFPIPADKSILATLQERGVDWPSSCESGTCGTCKMRLVDGAVEHRDVVLTEQERPAFMMPCVSRATDDEVVLDF